MESRGTITSIAKDFSSGQYVAQIAFKECNISELEELRGKDLAINAKLFRNRRSVNANALMWSCLGKIAEALGGSKDAHYLNALRHYGQFTTMTVREDAVERFKECYRECEEIGRRDGYVDLICYFGSSTYSTSEFSVLLDGVIETMRNAGIETPTDEEMKRSLEQWEKEHG